MSMCPCIFLGSIFKFPSFPQIRKGIRDSPHSYYQKEQVKNDQLRDSSSLKECEFL